MLACTGLLIFALAGCGGAGPWHQTDISGAMPDLGFTMTRADDGRTVTGDDYAGKVVALYFGYTHCPDVCPTTLNNIVSMLDRLGDEAKDVRVLFVTVDPDRDSQPLMKDYVSAFAPQVDGLRGTDAQLAALAKRYRVSYSVSPKSDGHAYEVSHGSAVYVFDRQGKIRLLFSGLSKPHPDIDGSTADLKRLLDSGGASGWFDKLVSLY